MSENFRIRPYSEADLDAVYEVCLKTGDAGQDATELYDDPKLLGHIYAGPYVVMEPESAFVLEDRNGVCGYVLGALNSDAFYASMRDQWLPRIKKDYAAPKGAPETWSRDEELANAIYHPGTPARFEEYPSHLHIDLLPRAQGGGWGKKMMDRIMDHMRASGSPGVHLGMAVTNDRAYRFYVAYGFVELKRNDNTIFMGLRFRA